MELSFLRDLVIVIFGILGIVATLMTIVLLAILYRKVTPILDYVKETASNLRDASSTVYKSVIEPISRIQDFIAGIRSVMDAISSITRKRGEKT
ncbi:MAG: hypothetical protein ACLFVK_03900 [Dehalococcoidia bacterium]